MKPRISMIALAVQDLSVSQRFYEEGLGFPRIASPPSVAFFDLNGTRLGLSERQALADDAGVPAEGSGYRGFSLAHNVASEQEVDAMIDLAVAASAKLIKAPTRAVLGRLPRLCQRSGRASLGDCA